MKLTWSALVENRPGVLTRVAGLFARRGFNIDSLAVGPSEFPEYSRLTIVVNQARHPMEQVTKQLRKLVDVITVKEMPADASVSRELMLVKLEVPPDKRVEILDVVKTFRGKVVDLSPEAVIVEATGNTEKLAALIEMLKPYGEMVVARTGVIALPRGTIQRNDMRGKMARERAQSGKEPQDV